MRASWFFALGAVLLAAYLTLTGDNAMQSLLTLVFIYATIGLGWNIIGGYAGQASFGHALFVGIGAYTVALLQREWDISPLVGVWPAMGLAVMAALLIGWPTFRLSGVYFSLATLAYPLMAMPLLTWLGLQEVFVPYRPDNGAVYLQFADPRQLTACALLLALVGVGVSLAVQHSRFGESLVAIREDPVAAAAAGVNVRRRKLQAYCISAAVTAAAGALLASVLYVLTPDSVFGLLVSVQALIIPIVGGRGTAWGPVIGAALLITLAEQLNASFGSTLPGVNGLMFGAALVLLVFVARDGLYWRMKDIAARIRPPSTAPAGALQAPDLLVLDASAPAHSRSAPVLEVAHIKRSFNGVRVLEDVSFEVRPGEVLGIIGPNGAGKTTLLNIVNGLVAPDDGTVHLSGTDVTSVPTHRRAHRGMGRTFQVARPLQRCSVERNVRVASLTVSHGAEVASRALHAVGLHQRADVPAAGLDAGELRRLELARALAGQPSVLLVDEILAGLSSDQVDEIVDLLRAIADHGVAVVIIEHTMSAMIRLADRLVMIDAGIVVTSGKPQDVLSDRRVVEAYLGTKWSSHA